MAYRDREQEREYGRRWRAANREQDRRLIRDGTITLDRFCEMFAAQSGLCASCSITLQESRGTHIDHDHVTGKVRGLLCGGCNSGIGLMRESPAVLRAAADYLERQS